MKNKPLAILSPICLCLCAAGARAAIEPFTLGASEAIRHESNINHVADQDRTSAWISTTEFTAALDQAVGRDKLVANAGVDYNAYKGLSHQNSWGYHAGAEFDWNTIGDVAGAFGADTSRRRYIYGVTSDAPIVTFVNGLPVVQGPTTELNMQTDDHVFGRLEIGGPSRWQIYGGADASRRHFSASSFQGENERQWTANLGTRYATSPDLHFGIVGRYTRGEYPDVASSVGGVVTGTEAIRFRTRALDATAELKATGNSAFDASVGYTTQSNGALSKDVRFVDGSLNWMWTPPSHFTVKLGLKRSSDIDAATTGLNTGVLGANNLNGISVNNTALLDVTYALTAKISLDGNASYSQRKYSDVRRDTGGDVSGTLNTTTFALYAHYQPTRNSDVSCGGGREVRHASAGIASFLPSYSDNTVRCVAAIKFD